MYLSAIIVAGGSGRRFGRKKQFLDLNGTPVLKRSVDCFLSYGSFSQIIVVVPEEDLPHARDLFPDSGETLLFVKGGDARQQSVFNGLQQTVGSDAVLIHDGVRPFVSHELISRVVGGLSDVDGCIPALAVTDTLKEVGDGIISRTVSRRNLYQVQTPQAFKTRELLDVHRQASTKGILDNTDDSSLMESSGKTIRVVPGDPFNLKITFEDDLKLAEAMLSCHIV